MFELVSRKKGETNIFHPCVFSGVSEKYPRLLDIVRKIYTQLSPVSGNEKSTRYNFKNNDPSPITIRYNAIFRFEIDFEITLDNLEI